MAFITKAHFLNHEEHIPCDCRLNDLRRSSMLFRKFKSAYRDSDSHLSIQLLRCSLFFEHINVLFSLDFLFDCQCLNMGISCLTKIYLIEFNCLSEIEILQASTLAYHKSFFMILDRFFWKFTYY